MNPAANIAEIDRKEDWIEADSFGVSVGLEVVLVTAVLEREVLEVGVEAVRTTLRELNPFPSLVQEVLLV